MLPQNLGNGCGMLPSQDRDVKKINLCIAIGNNDDADDDDDDDD